MWYFLICGKLYMFIVKRRSSYTGMLESIGERVWEISNDMNRDDTGYRISEKESGGVQHVENRYVNKWW